STWFKTRLDQLRKGASAVADLVFEIRIEFSEGQIIAIRYEYGVVAEAALAARRPGQLTIDLAAERLDRGTLLRWRPGQRQHRDEMGAARLVAQLALHPLHRDAEILGRAGPARRIDPGRAIERRNHQPGIIGKRGQAACVGRG